MIKTKKRFFGIYTKKINTDTGMVKTKILGFTVKKCIDEKYKKDIEKCNPDEILAKVRQFYEFIAGNCKQDSYNLVLHRHLGDSFVILCLKDIFEKQYNKQLHFFIRPRQELLMKMFDIKNYTLYDVGNFLEIKDYANQVGISNIQQADKLEENIYVNLFTSVPVLNHPFICNPIDYLKNKCPYENFVHGWAVMLGLDVSQIKTPKLHIELSGKTAKELESFDFNKIICFAPEANSCKEINLEFWNLLAEKLVKKGYCVIVNSVNQKNKINNAKYLDCPLSDFIAIAQKSKAIFMLRSGLADILANIHQNCYVFSTEEIYKDYFYMNKIYDLPYKVKEIKLNTKIKGKNCKKLIDKLFDDF